MQKNKVIHARVNLLFLKKAAENGWLHTFSYYLKFKYSFSSSMLIGGRYSTLADLTGHDINTVRVHVGRMIQLGWVTKDISGNLIFCSLETLWKNLKQKQILFHYNRFTHSTITFNIGDSSREIRDRLILFRIEKSVRGQDFAKKTKQDYLALSYSPKKHESWGTLRRRKNLQDIALRQMNVSNSALEVFSVEERQLETTISCRRIGVFDGMTRPSTGCRIKKRLIAGGFISAEKNLKQVKLEDYGMRSQFVDHITYETWMRVKSHLPKNCYYHRNGNRIMQRDADIIYIVPPPTLITKEQTKSFERMIVA